MWKLLHNFIFYNHQRWLTVQALFLSACARFVLRFVAISRLHPFLGEAGVESSWGALPRESMRDVGRISRRVGRVARKTPWESKCFVQALVAQTLLKNRRLPSTLYLGVGKDENEKPIAHAWIRCSSYYVTGGNGDGYAVVAKFTRYPRRSILPRMDEEEPSAPEGEAPCEAAAPCEGEAPCVTPMQLEEKQ